MPPRENESFDVQEKKEEKNIGWTRGRGSNEPYIR